MHVKYGFYEEGPNFPSAAFEMKGESLCTYGSYKGNHTLVVKLITCQSNLLGLL